MRNRSWIIWTCLPLCTAGCALHQAGAPVKKPSTVALKPAAAAAMQDCPPEVMRPRSAAVAEAERPTYRREVIPKAAIPASVGTSVNAWESAMISESQVQQQMLARHLWYSAGATPGPEGRRRIGELAEQMRSTAGLLVLEAEPVQPEYDESVEDAVQRTEDLNLQRRAWVIEQLAASGVVNAEQRVVFGSQRPLGIRGIEAPRIYNSLAIGGFGQGQGQGGGGMGGGMQQGGGMGGGGFGGGGGMF